MQKTLVRTKLITIFLLSFSSGLPFLLILSTFSIWLAEVLISKTQIGLLAWLTIPYTCKFLFSPFVDKVKIPFLFKYLGQRKSWILFSQIALTLALLLLGYTEPNKDLLFTAIVAFMVGLFSAIQDIVVEAYRIEIIDKSKLNLSASISVLGYRFGMLCSGAGAIYIAEYFHSWAVAYHVMACCMLVGIITTLMAIEPENLSTFAVNQSFKNWIINIFVEPVKTFFVHSQWKTIIMFVLCYKFADTVLNVMSMPFLLEMGFNKIEIANVAKTFGIIAMVCGGISGGVLLSRYGLWKLLFLASALQFVAGCLFVEQAKIGYNLPFLFVTMGIENFTCGLAQVVLITYFSMLCVRPYTAVHYAVLSSFASLVRVSCSMIAGWLADKFIWEDFYLIVCFSCILSIIILQCCTNHFVQYKKENKTVLV